MPTEPVFHLTYRSSLHQAIKVAVEVWCKNVQVKRVDEYFKVVGHFLNSEKRITMMRRTNLTVF